ncbi:MAG: uncharacterized protein JWP75_12 [Frondihabitans sp.]|nr:uncharacterized protein [Frondihabitans sp.]
MTNSFTIAVFCGSSAGDDPVYLREAYRVGTILADRGIGLVYGGGHVGLMGAVADGVMEGGGTATGVIPHQLQSREESNYDITELIVVDSMHERKAIMAERSDAFLALPGGPGTLEEITEQWTWAQLGIHQKPCGVLNIDGYYDPLAALVANMRDHRFTHPRFTEILAIDSDIDVLLDRFLSYVPPLQHHLSPGQELAGDTAEPPVEP